MNLIRSIYCLLLCSIAFSLQSVQAAQPGKEKDPESKMRTYSIKTKNSLPIFAIGTISWAMSHYFENKVIPFTEDQIDGLNVPSRGILFPTVHRNWSPGLAKLSDAGLIGSLFLMPIAGVLSKENRSQYREVSLMALECLILTDGLTRLTKSLGKRSRPYVYNPDAPLEKKLEQDARFSFFSGHTSFSAMASFFCISVLNRPDLPRHKMVLIWTVGSLIPAGVGAFRVLSGKHYFTDVFAGYLVGASIGYFIPKIHLMNHSSKLAFEVKPMGNGLSLNLKF